MSYSGGRWAPIVSLPAELLLIILKIVYVETREVVPRPHHWCENPCDCKSDLNEPDLTKWDDDVDLRCPSLFPYALSSVCKEWFNLMLLVPEFWTRLVIFVDMNPTAITDPRAQLSASRDLPFQAHILNRQETTCEDNKEGGRVQAVVDALSPYSHRCERLTFDVMHNSSLPSIRRNFSGSYPLLTELSMECKIHDTNPQQINKESEARRDPFTFPSLNCVTLTGSAFADAYENPSWLQGIETKKLKSFSISHLSSIEIPNFTLLDFLSILNELRGISQLELKYVDLPIQPDGDIPADWDFQLNIGRLFLVGLKKEIFQGFDHLEGRSHYDSKMIQACELSRCSIDYSYHLYLQDIHSTEDILSIVPTLSNPCVSFISCRGLTDAVLEQLSMLDPDRGMWNLEMLNDLTIWNSHGISVQALKNLVENRRVDAAARGYGGAPDYIFGEMGPIESLSVSHCVLEFSSEDIQWFREKVKYFSFDP